MAASLATRAGDDGILSTLTSLFQDLIDHSDAIRAEFREKFQALRILVVGKAGCGKTSLIRLLVGDDGIVQGRVDMSTKWRWKADAAASFEFVIHDSKGIDGSGEERTAEIRAFLDRYLKSENHVEFWDRVHLVWYVFRAVDNRVLDDGGLLEMLHTGYGKLLPIQLIVTHCDVAKAIGGNMEERVLAEVLGRVSDEEIRRSLKEWAVRVGNRTRWDRKTGKMIDVDGDSTVTLRRLVTDKTKQLMNDDKLRSLWANCEASITKHKLEASVELILRLERGQAAISSLVGAVPMLHPAKLTASLGQITRELNKIWNASDRLVPAEDIAHAFLHQELKQTVSRILWRTRIWGAALAISLACTAFMGLGFIGSEGLPTVSLGSMGGGIVTSVAVFGGSALHQAYRTAKIFLGHSLHLLGAITYAKTHYENRSGGGGGVKANAEQQVKEFMASKWASEVTSIAEGFGSLTDTFLHGERQQERLMSEMVTFFQAVALRSVDGSQSFDFDFSL